MLVKLSPLFPEERARSRVDPEPRKPELGDSSITPPPTTALIRNHCPQWKKTVESSLQAFKFLTGGNIL